MNEQHIQAEADAIIVMLYTNGYFSYTASLSEAKNELSAFLAGAQFAQQWISVEDRMPEPLTGVIVFIPEEDFHITSGMWDISQKWVLLDEYRTPECKVTYWMPEPDIPKEYRAQRDENNKIMNWLKGILPPSPGK